MIGILGGTFDPVHNAHIRVGRDVIETLDLRELRLVPCRIPPHRDMPVASARQRAEMVSAAIRDEPRMVIDLRELRREGPSYMIDTLESIRSGIADEPLALLVGGDAFLDLAGWHRWRDVPRVAHIVVMQRPGSQVQPGGELARFLVEHETGDADSLHHRPAGRILRTEVTQMDVSATGIRRRIHSGGDWQSLVPRGAVELIRDQGLYL